MDKTGRGWVGMGVKSGTAENEAGRAAEGSGEGQVGRDGVEDGRRGRDGAEDVG